MERDVGELPDEFAGSLGRGEFGRVDDDVVARPWVVVARDDIVPGWNGVTFDVGLSHLDSSTMLFYVGTD
jgi:hypothetical protein